MGILAEKRPNVTNGHAHTGIEATKRYKWAHTYWRRREKMLQMGTHIVAATRPNVTNGHAHTSGDAIKRYKWTRAY